MYLDYWKLSRVPFAHQNEPEFYFPAVSHRSALLKLRYALGHAGGAGLLMGGSGAGKSFLVSRLAHTESSDNGSDAESVPEPLVHLMYSRMNAAEMLCYLAVELGADSASLSAGEPSLDRVLRAFETCLRNHADAGNHPLIVIDEAHLIDDPAVWQAVQLLLNYAQRPDLRLGMLFVGDRTLAGKIYRYPQLENRVSIRALLQPLSADETTAYLNHRLRVAGTDQALFSDAACHTLFELSGGVPQQINRLADLALLVGYAEGLKSVTAHEVEAVSEELSISLPAA